MNLITAALQGLAAIPRVIDLVERLIQEFNSARERALMAKIDEVFAELEKPTTAEKKRELAKSIQDLIRR